MVQFQAFGSTSKYCFICAAPCYVPRGSETPAELSCRDRRHLSNTRILSRQGISHPGLTWRYSEEQNAMLCLGYACRVYGVFDPTIPDCCLSVHRSCYTLLLDNLERSEGSAGLSGLMQRILSCIDRRGVLLANLLSDKHRQQKQKQKRQSTLAGVNKPDTWLMCDPTDLPTVTMPDNWHCVGGYEAPSLTLLVPPRDLRFDNDPAQMCFEEGIDIPSQLLTPPMSPVEDTEGTFLEQPSKPNIDLPHIHNLLMLPPHILLSIVSHLHSPDITTLSQSCSIFRIYLAPTSPVWAQVCRLAFTYTPKYLSNQQIAEYYLRVRGNNRLENQVLVQRQRVERIVHYIVHLQPAF